MKGRTSRRSRPQFEKKRRTGNRLWRRYYDVVVIPPADIQEYAIEVSRRLKRLGGNWALGRRAFIPHISLYHIPVRDDQFDAFASEVRRVASATKPQTLKITGFDMPVLEVSKPKWLDDLHRRIVSGACPLLDRDYHAEDTWDLDFFSGRRRTLAEKYVKQYGTPMFGMNFRPHITLTSFRPAKHPESFDLDVAPMTFTPDRLTICELGESHSCQRIVDDACFRI